MVPPPKQGPTHPLPGTKPIPFPGPNVIKEQYMNNDLGDEDEKTPPPLPPAPPAKPPKKPKADIKPHPVFLEWNEERVAAGFPASKVGPQNNTFAARLGELVPEPAVRRNVLKAFFARKDDSWLVEEGFVFYQLVNHRLDQCVAAASKRESQPERHETGELGGLAQMRAAREEAMRMMGLA